MIMMTMNLMDWTLSTKKKQKIEFFFSLFVCMVKIQVVVVVVETRKFKFFLFIVRFSSRFHFIIIIIIIIGEMILNWWNLWWWWNLFLFLRCCLDMSKIIGFCFLSVSWNDIYLKIRWFDFLYFIFVCLFEKNFPCKTFVFLFHLV